MARVAKTAYFALEMMPAGAGFWGRQPADAGFGGSNQSMAKSDEPITIKKYANRRLYNTGTSTYVTLEDLATMVKAGENFVVYDAKTNEDITRSVLTQIIFEQENKEGGQNLLPVNFLRQLIRFYGDSMQMMVPRYLEVSIDSLTREQAKLREQMSSAFGMGGFGAIEEQVRRNMEMFERTFSMFTPFARQGQGGESAADADKGAKPATASPTAGGGDIDDLKRQMDEMQKRIDRIGDKDK
jgi:polyhydroxyalkanoate synthesis repressor PhaR